MSVISLFGYNPSTGTDRLLAVYGSDIVRVDTGVGYGQNVFSTNKAEFESFLDKAWFVNGSDKNRHFDGTTWTTTGKELNFPKARFIKRYKTRLYVAYITIRTTNYPSRVWYSDLPENNLLTWDYETQTNLQQTVETGTVRSPGAQFKTYGIKVGDPFTILTGGNIGQYNVASVDSETQLTLTDNLVAGGAAATYWVGGNWFDVNTDDNDVIPGLGENGDRLLVFKNDSLHRFDGTTLKQVKGVPGTTSGRSVVNIRDYTLYFHRTGIYRYDGVSSTLISRGIQEYIDGIVYTNYNAAVAWKVGEEVYRCFVGDISNSDAGISLSNAYLDYDLATQTWSVGTYTVSIYSATSYIESQAQNTFLGTTASEVYQDNIGNDDGETTPIEWNMETAWHFPFGTQV